MRKFYQLIIQILYLIVLWFLKKDREIKFDLRFRETEFEISIETTPITV